MKAPWLTLGEVKTEIRTQMRDTGTSNQRWSDAEIYQAVRQGLRLLTGMLPTKGVYTATLSSANSYITLPAYVTHVKKVRARDYATTSGDYYSLLYWEHESFTDADDRLWYHKEHSDLALIIDYECAPPDVPGEMTLDGAINDSVVSLKVHAADLAVASRFEEYGHFKIDSEVIKHTGPKASDNLTFEGLTRAQLGTAKASHADDAVVYPLIEVPNVRVYNWLVDYSAGRLHRTRLVGSTSADLAGDVSAMRDYDQAAERALRRILPFNRTVHLNVARPRRVTR